MSLKKKVTKIIIVQAAETEYLNFAAYYEQQQKGLGERFVADFTSQLIYLQDYPFAFQYKFRKFRVAFMARFPCMIVYKVDKSEIIVHAVRHSRENPKRLRKLK
ncbi:MAG: type II toxin-antitoxin system RelE/ParE family toxin [Bacteroidota bacterium]|jgi:toxin ParE1/3/4